MQFNDSLRVSFLFYLCRFS